MVSRRSLETATALLTGAFGAAVIISSLDNGIGWSSAGKCGFKGSRKSTAYAAQMVATAEASALAVTSGVDMHKLHEVLLHSTGDCVAVRTRLPVAGVVPDSPASNGWKPGFMTDLMAKDLDLALHYARSAGVPLATTGVAREALGAATAAGYGREDFSALAKVVFARSGLT